jgi:hypothetical protein
MSNIGWVGGMGWLVAAAFACGACAGNAKSENESQPVEQCKGLDLASWCAADPRTDVNQAPRCPSAINEIPYACGDDSNITLRYTSSCGGFSFVVTRGTAKSIWHYDAASNLVGASITPDTTSTGAACTAAATHVYGKTCELSGAPLNVCVQSNAPCVRPLGCPDPKDSPYVQHCPSSPEALLSLCDGTVKVSRFASSCGGSIIHADFGTHSEDWAFDAAKQLIGENFQDDIAAQCPDGTQSSLSVFGQACAPQGQPEILCDYAPSLTGSGGGSP